jgi:hypothetical protein
MTDNNIKANINFEEFQNIKKQYKKIKKYMKSSLYEIKKLDGTETLITNLLKENEQDTI